MFDKKLHILTFDLEDWFHILDNASTRSEQHWAKYDSRVVPASLVILDLLERRGQKATFFCLGWIAEKYPSLVRTIAERGHDIATHSHLHQLVYEQSPEAFRHDVERSMKALEDCVGTKVHAFRAPGFSIGRETRWAFDILIGLGIEIDCSVFPVARSHGGFRSFGAAEPAIIMVNGHKIKEFPVSTYPTIAGNLVYSGGGYFRLFPYWAVKSMLRNSPYAMTYYHPRDFDSSQPVLRDLPILRRFKSYVGLKNAFAKLDRLLSDFQFVDVKTADELVEWNGVKTLSL